MFDVLNREHKHALWLVNYLPITYMSICIGFLMIKPRLQWCHCHVVLVSLSLALWPQKRQLKDTHIVMIQQIVPTVVIGLSPNNVVLRSHNEVMSLSYHFDGLNDVLLFEIKIFCLSIVTKLNDNDTITTVWGRGDTIVTSSITIFVNLILPFHDPTPTNRLKRFSHKLTRSKNRGGKYSWCRFYASRNIIGVLSLCRKF